MVFVGTHERALDDKGRLVLPARFRSHFSLNGFTSPGPGCVALHTAEGFEEMTSRLTEQIKAGEMEPMAIRKAMASTEEVRLDAQGRVTISRDLREFASLEREVVVCGFIDRIEIWNADKWTDMATELDRSVVDAFRLGGGI